MLNLLEDVFNLRKNCSIMRFLGLQKCFSEVSLENHR